MEKLKKLHGLLESEGYEPGDFETFVATYSDPVRQEKLHKLLETEGYEPEPIDKFRQTYFSATPAVVDQKKKTTPDQGVGSPVSQPQSKTASVVTPQSKPAISPALGENIPVVQPPVAKVGTAKTIGYDEALAQKAAHEKKRSETIASVAMGLERNFGPNKFLKTKIEGILADETKSQDERDVLALEEAYNTYKNAGYKRGGKAIKETSTEQSFGDRLARKDSPQIVLEADADELWRALGDAEANMRKNDPQAWQRKMNKESDTYYKTRGVKNGDQQAMYSAITRQLTGFAEGGLMEKEADLRMQAKELGGFMGKMDQRFGANPNDPERSEMLAKKSAILKQADELRNMRHREQLETIDALKKRLYDPSITDFELKAGREALRRAEQEERGFFDPTYQIQAATEANKEEIAIANEGENGGKTPQERIQRYFTSLLAEERRLNGRISGDATNTQAAIEQLSGVIPGGGREWTPDELRYKQVREKIRSLAPIVYLNEADVSREGGVKPALRNFGEIMTGGGVIGADLDLESPQARAGNITEAMIVSGLDPQKAMSTNYKEAIDRNIQGYGLGDPQYWMEQAGMVGGILIQAIPGAMVTRGLGAEALIAKMGKAITSTTKAGKALKILANTSANALKRGVEFEISGQASPNNYEELNFASGLLGGVGESMGKGVLKTGEKLIGKLFGDQAQQAYGLIARYGGEKTGLGNAGGFVQGRTAMGIGESFGESTESLVHAWQKSEPGHDFWEGMKEEFGDTFDENVKFFVSTFMLGLALGGGNQGGIASGLMDSAREQYAAATPEQQEVMDQVLEDTGSGLEYAHTQAMQESEAEWLREQESEFKERIDKGNLSVEEGAAAQQSIDAIRKRLSEIESSRAAGLNPTPEDVASVEAEQEGIEPEKKKELKPEAQAAQAELERRAAIDKTMVEQGLGDRVNTAQSQEDRLREERDALVAQQGRQELTDNEKKRLADLETVVTGLDQIAAGEQFVSPAPEVQTEIETIVTNSGETIKPVEGSDTKKKVTIDVEGIPLEIEFDTEGLGEDLETFQATLTPDAKDAFVESPAPTEETPASPVAEENPFGEPTPREQPRRRDQQIVEQIDEFFNNLAGAVSEGSKEQLKKYARRILAGEDIAKVMQGQSARSIELVNEVIKQIQQESAPATDESIIDVTEEAPTPIAAEETVAAESPAQFEVKTYTRGDGKGEIDLIQTGNQYLDADLLPNGESMGGIEPKSLKDQAFLRERIADLESDIEDSEKNGVPVDDALAAIEFLKSHLNNGTKSSAPVTQKKGKGAANGGKSKPKANPNRKTKSKPVADLTPTEVVSEAIAASAEVDENPTPENKEREAQIEERIENNIVSPTPVKVKLFAKGDGGTKGVFIGEDGKLYKSIEPQETVQDKDGTIRRKSIDDAITDEHEILSSLQGNPHIPRVGKIVDTTEGKAFEIERLDEVDTFTQEEYREIQKILNDLNDKGYHVGDQVTVMKRPKTGELVVVDFSAGYKGSRMSRDADDYMQGIKKKLSSGDAVRIEQEDKAESDRFTAETLSGDESTTEYYLTRRPPSIGTHPTDGMKSIKETEFRGKKVWVIAYDRKLSAKEVANFELTPKITNKEFLGQRVTGIYGKGLFYVSSIDYDKGTVTLVSELKGKEISITKTFKEFREGIDEGKYKVEQSAPAVTQEVATETEVVAESPTPAPKTKKSRGKQQALPEGVEDMFTEARVSGRRTSWMKKDGKWLFRNHKPGTKISEQQFERDWQEATGKDIDRAERMAAMDPLSRELANSAKEWVAAWGDLVTLRNPYGKGDGKVFASVDLGIVGNSIKLGAKTAKVGINLARVLAQNGVYTYENWRKGMIQALGDHVLPFLDQAWESVKTIIPEGSTSADIQSNVVEDQAGEEANEKSKETKKKKEPVEDSGEKTGTQKLMEKYISKAGEVLAKVIANSPMLKSVYDQKAQYEKALKEVKEAIAANKVGQLMERLEKPATDWETADVDQFQRMILVDLYRTLADNATEERNRAAVTGDKAAEKQAQKDLDRFLANTTAMLNAMSASALGAGRTGAASGMWRFIGGSMDTYAMGVIDKANRAIAKSKKTANGKTLEETSKEIADNLNEEKKKKANEIADSVDGAIDNGVNQSKPKRKSSTIAGKTAAEFAELKRQAKEKYDSIRLGGTMNAILSPNGFAKTAAAAEFGYYALLEGAVTFKDWVASMKKDLPDLTDQELADIWDSELNGRTLSEESKNVLREKALKSINSALSSSERAVENTDSAKEAKKLRDQMAKDLAATIEAGESIDEFKKKYGLTDEQAEDLSESIAKADQAAIDKLAGKKVKGFNPKVYLPKPKGPASTDAQKADAKKKAETRVKVKEVIRDHFANPDGQPLIDKLTEAGLDLEQAQKVEQAVRDNAQVILAQAVAGELDHIQSGESKRKNRDYKPPKKGGKKRTNAEILIDNLVDGNITDRFVQGLVRHKFGMGRTATAEEVTRLRKLGKAVKEAQAGSVFEKMAMKELATLIDSMMPKTMTEDLSALLNGLIMSSVLNSVSTILVNPYSVTDHWILGAVKSLIDPQQWMDLFNALTKKDGGNPALLNPLAKILTKMMAGHKPTLSAIESFTSGMVTGTTSGKYDESVMDSDPSKMLPALEREQRTAFGRAITAPKWWNPYSHIFGKTIGRILSATDAGMTMAYGDLEFLDALRVAIGKKPNGSIAELKALAGEYLSQKSQLWQDSLQQAKDEAAAMEALTGKHVPDITVEVRAREIVRKKFASDPRVMLDESEMASIQKVAQYNTLTLKRQGGFGKAATVMAKLKSGDEKWQKALALILKPFILFTEIPGNYGDALLDNTPIYSIFRALGISPTGLAQRAGWTETSAAIGEWGSRERRKQLEQAFFSNVLFIAAYALIGMDDDDDDVTGKQINTDESYQLFGIPYKAFASLAPSLIFARVLRDSEKDPKFKTMSAPEAGFMRMTSAMTALSGFYTDQSFMKGIQDFGRLATTLAEFSKGETTTQAAFRAVIRPYLNLATKPLPQTQGVTKFILDCFDPHKYTEEDWSEMFAMTIGMERINNEKKIGLFGEEYLQYPGYNVLNVKSLIDKAAGDHPMKRQYEFLARTKTFIKAPTNPVAKFLDPKSSTGFTFREFTPNEWYKLNKKAGEYFLKDLNTYMNSKGVSLGGKIDVAGNKLLSQTQTDILDKWSKARSKAKKELFGKILLSDTEAQNLLNENFPENK